MAASSERAEAALKAGCDVVLQCSGVLKEMQETGRGLPPNWTGLPLVRARAVEAFAKRAAEATSTQKPAGRGFKRTC